jgi:hypothetical protein
MHARNPSSSVIQGHCSRCQHVEVTEKRETPVRSFRIPDDVYMPALAKAQARGDSLAEIVTTSLIEYLRDYE